MPKAVQIQFGCWPRDIAFTTAGIDVEPLPNFSETLDKVNAWKKTRGRWISPPESADGFRPFALPATHVMHVKKGSDRERLGEFAIAVLGAIEGLRLVPEGWVHFYRAAVELHSLCDLICSKQEIEHILGKTQEFWRRYRGADIRRNLFGTIHWFLFSQSYEHEFEQFAAQYTVLDSSFRLLERLGRVPPGLQPARGQRIPHSRRPSILAKSLGLRVPSWARVGAKDCPLSRLRNSYVHEGLYGGKPIGFTYPRFRPSITLQLTAFNLRAILSLLDVRCAYVRSHVNTREMRGLDLLA